MHQAKKYRFCSTCPNKREEWQTCKKLFYIVLIINFILAIALVVTVYYWKSPEKTLTLAVNVKDSHCFCLQCEEISVHPLDDDNLLKEFERKDNGTKCCTTDTSKVKHLVHQFLERKHRIHMAKEGITIPKCQHYESGKKPAGRVVGVHHIKTGIDNEDRHVLQWLNTEKGSYQTPGVTFSDGQLEITTPGYYWFSSRVTFRDTNTAFANDRFAYFHTILRRSAEYPLREDMKLVEAGQTRCKAKHGYTDRSSFIGDIAYFKKGEQIIVKVSDPEIISLTSYDSFLEVRLY